MLYPKKLTKSKQKSKILITKHNALIFSIVFSNVAFLPRFLPQMYIYIGFNTIIDFCRVSGANKRVFADCQVLHFCKGTGGGTPSDHRPPTDCHLIGFSENQTYSVSKFRIFWFYNLFSST